MTLCSYIALVALLCGCGTARFDADQKRIQEQTELDHQQTMAALDSEHQQRKEALARDVIAESESRVNFVKAHPDLAPDVRTAILSREVVVGMPEEAVRVSWGRPQSVTTTRSASGQSELWIYLTRSVILQDGKVSSFTVSK